MAMRIPRLTSEKNLFLDEAMLDSLNKVKQTLHQPVKHPSNPVVRPHAAWISMALVFGSVIREDDRWRMWYFGMTELGRAVCYAESSDGLNWRQPALPLVKYRGETTNIVITPDILPDYGEIFGVMPKPDAKSHSERYLAFYVKLFRDETKSPLYGLKYDLNTFRRPKWYFADRNHPGLYAATSPDGIHWKASERPMFDYPADISYLLYDTRLKKYVVYGRLLNRRFFRTVQRLESSDLVSWQPHRPKEVFAPDENDPEETEIYSMMVMNYGTQYVGFPQIYHKPSGTLQIQLTVSRDGVQWSRVAKRKVWLSEGGPGEWDRFNISLASAPVINGKELWFYYGGRTCRHTDHSYRGRDNGQVWGAVGLATIRIDGFVSLAAGFESGEVTTIPLLFSGDELHVNVHSPFGRLVVDLLDPETKRILATSDPLTIDSVDAAVTWNGRSKIPFKGKPVMIHFNLINAGIFSYWSS